MIYKLASVIFWHITLASLTCLSHKSIKRKSNDMKNYIFLLLFIMCFSLWNPHIEGQVNLKIFITKVKSLKNQDFV